MSSGRVRERKRRKAKERKQGRPPQGLIHGNGRALVVRGEAGRSVLRSAEGKRRRKQMKEEKKCVENKQGKG